MVRNIQLRVSLKEEGQLGLKAKTAKYLGVSEDTIKIKIERKSICLLYTSPSPRDRTRSRMPSSA